MAASHAIVFAMESPTVATSTTAVVSDPGDQTAAVEADTGGGPFEVQYRMQLLQQEVMELRGLLEELTFRLERMQAMRDARYLDLDARLQQLLEMKAARPAPAEESPGNEPGDIERPRTLGEQALYDESLRLVRNRDYEAAVEQLESLIARFPAGDYTANAYYWLGEVYAAKPLPDYEKARQALAQVISYFPAHRKVPDAAYKLGKIYHLLGDCTRAQEILEQVAEQHKGKSVARLAEDYLKESVQCDR